MKIKLELCPKGVAVGLMTKAREWVAQSQMKDAALPAVIAEYEANKLGFTLFDWKVEK